MMSIIRKLSSIYMNIHFHDNYQAAMIIGLKGVYIKVKKSHQSSFFFLKKKKYLHDLQ